ncbi:MAG: serine hydrolase domain-containing protein [Verrucomicrobiota bacterium]
MIAPKVVIFLFTLPLLVCQTSQAQTKIEREKSALIKAALIKSINQNKIPGMLAAIIDSDGLIAIAAAGVRKSGNKKKITPQDLVHLGSCTKAMTSTLLARFVDESSISWETTLIEVFPEYKNKIHPDYHQTTLWQLATHRSGIATNAQDWRAHRNMTIKVRRQTIMLENLKQASAGKPGEFLYSNLGYMTAACMIEKLSRTSWEDLMKSFIFKPLDMKSAGFGAPGRPGEIKQPWGHIKKSGRWSPIQSDNAAALGPAGRVHCSLQDWAKFIALQLPEKTPVILNRKKLDRLIQPTGEYAAGWLVTQRTWGKGTVLSHSGSNTMWHALLWVAPKLDRAYLVVTNSNDEKSTVICDDMIGKLIAIDK